MLRVVTWRWHDPEYRWNPIYRYTPEHVNRLARAVRENLRLPHEFVCLTDDAEGLDPEIRVMPAPDRYAELGMCWRRLWLFSHEAREALGERVAQMDLDCVVTGDLTPLFDRPESFVVWRHGKADRRNRGLYCASMLLMTPGAHAEVWEEFDPAQSPAMVKNIVGSDQAWLTHILGPEMPTWTREDGVYSYRADFHGGSLPGHSVRRGRSRAGPPDDCRIVFFHGPFDPSMPEVRRQHPWIDRYWSEACH